MRNTSFWLHNNYIQLVCFRPVLKPYRIPWKSVFTLCNYFVTTGRVYYIHGPNFKRNTRTRGFANNKAAIKGGNVCRLLILLLLLLLWDAPVLPHTRQSCVSPCLSWLVKAPREKARGITGERYRNTDGQQHIVHTHTRAPLASCWR